MASETKTASRKWLRLLSPWGAALALIAVSSACAREAPTVALGMQGGFENLLLITIDTTRADRLGCYGYEAGSTPILDGLAQRGVRFERCISPTPITLPSHTSILTGDYPYSHGARNNGTHHVAPEVSSLAERLSQLEFATGAVLSAFVLDSRFGLDQGFDSYDDDLAGGSGETDYGYRETQADDTRERASRWLDERGEERWFLWVHFFDPHSDYSPPEPFRSRFAASPYDGEIAYVDSEIGELLAHLRARDELEQTLVIVTSDHGEALGEHGETTHGVFLYDATTHVPLILSHPRLQQGRAVKAVVSSVDIVPSALELLGAPASFDFDGRSLAAVLCGAEQEPDPRPAYSESMLPYYNYGWAQMRALRDEQRRFVRAPRPELYELTRDPQELHDLGAEAGEQLAHYDALLSELLPARELDSKTGSASTLEPEVLESLAALGYTFSSEQPASDEHRPDPKDRVQMISDSVEAERLVAEGRLDQAERLYRATIAQNPSSVTTRNSLAQLLVRMEKFSEALEVQRGSLGMPGASVMNHVIVAQLEQRLGLEGWQRSLEFAKLCDPRDPLPWVQEGGMVHMPHDPQKAVAAYREALALDQNYTLAWIGICEAEASRRNLPAALEAATRATEVDPQHSLAWFHRGSMNAAAGNRQAAVEHLRRSKELEPTHLQTRLGLSLLLLSLADEPGASSELSAALELDEAQVRAMAARNPALAKLLERLP